MIAVARIGVGAIEERASICSCELERARTVDAELELAPELGRQEWRGWTRALAELLRDLADGPVHVLILTQPACERYVQVVVGHGEARVEASSNAHLRGDRLFAHDERRLASLGYRRPDAASPYWTLEEPVGLPEQLAELVAHTLVGIFGLDATSPLHVGRFGADRPCRTCSWAA
jgi:hypothetical protein